MLFFCFFRFFSQHWIVFKGKGSKFTCIYQRTEFKSLLKIEDLNSVSWHILTEITLSVESFDRFLMEGMLSGRRRALGGQDRLLWKSGNNLSEGIRMGGNTQSYK